MQGDGSLSANGFVDVLRISEKFDFPVCKNLCGHCYNNAN